MEGMQALFRAAYSTQFNQIPLPPLFSVRSRSKVRHNIWYIFMIDLKIQKNQNIISNLQRGKVVSIQMPHHEPKNVLRHET